MRLEKELRLGNGTIGKWQNSAGNPSLKVLNEIAKYFDIPIAELIEMGGVKS